MEKLTTTAEETRKLIKNFGDVYITDKDSIQVLANSGPMDWFYFRKLDEFASFIDEHKIRYGTKQKVDGGTLTFALMTGEVLGYISIPDKVDNTYRYMVAVKSGVIDGLD
jgi:hypothetical protein